MNNSQKTVYIIALAAILIVIVNGLYSTRIMNGYTLKKNALIALNTEDGHGINISQEVDFVSFETGLTYNLKITDFPNPDNSTISLAIPIKNLKPNTKYTSELRFNMETNSPDVVKLKSNSNISMEQTSFETDINYKPVSLNNGNKEYMVEFKFETNDEGVGYAIFDFKVDNSIETLKINLNNVVFSKFKEIENDNVDTEQASETSLEIV